MAKKDNIDQQLDLFSPSFAHGIAIKDQQDIMRYPFFSLSKSKRVTPIEYDDGTNKVQVIAPEETGIANIFDLDILIYAASQIAKAQNEGLEVSPHFEVSAYDMLTFLGKSTGGKEYKRLKSSMRRLHATTITTTIRSEDNIRYEGGFHWIDQWKSVEKNGKGIAIRFKLSDWIYRGIVNQKFILTVDREFLKIESGLERFLYRLCRKVVGKQPQGYLEMRLKTVHQASAVKRKHGAFRKMVEKCMNEQSIPGYWILIYEKPGKVPFLYAIARAKHETPQKGLQRLLKSLGETKNLRAFRKDPRKYMQSL